MLDKLLAQLPLSSLLLLRTEDDKRMYLSGEDAELVHEAEEGCRQHERCGEEKYGSERMPWWVNAACYGDEECEEGDYRNDEANNDTNDDAGNEGRIEGTFTRRGDAFVTALSPAEVVVQQRDEGDAVLPGSGPLGSQHPPEEEQTVREGVLAEEGSTVEATGSSSASLDDLDALLDGTGDDSGTTSSAVKHGAGDSHSGEAPGQSSFAPTTATATDAPGGYARSDTRLAAETVRDAARASGSHVAELLGEAEDDLDALLAGGLEDLGEPSVAHSSSSSSSSRGRVRHSVGELAAKPAPMLGMVEEASGQIPSKEASTALRIGGKEGTGACGRDNPATASVPVPSEDDFDEWFDSVTQ